MLTKIREIDQIFAWRPLLDKLQDALTSADFSYLNIWGSRGVGKTMFLELYYNLINRRDNTVLNIPNVEKTPYALLKEDVTKFLESTSKSKKKKIILLDHLDALNENDKVDFEKILKNAILKEGAFIVATSQAKLIWTDAIVRNSSDFFAIPPLTNKDVKKLSTTWGLNPISAYNLTFGHPQALFWLRENSSLDKSKMAERARIFFLEDISEQGKELALFTSLFPGFDISTIEELSPANGKFPNKSIDAINNLLTELLNKGLIILDEENEYYYRFSDGAVRRLLASYFHERYPDVFENTHHLATEYFQKAAKYSGYLKIVFINVLYHLAFSAKSKKEAGQLCLSWVKENLSLTDEIDQGIMLKGWESGNGDPSVIDELKEMIGIKYYQEIQSTIEKATYSVQVGQGESSHE